MKQNEDKRTSEPYKGRANNRHNTQHSSQLSLKNLLITAEDRLTWEKVVAVAVVIHVRFTTYKIIWQNLARLEIFVVQSIYFFFAALKLHFPFT